MANARKPRTVIVDANVLINLTHLDRLALGRGESACLVLARRHEWLLASDEKGRFHRAATSLLGTGRIVNTAGLFVLAIRSGLLSVEDADQAKSILERHRFRLPFRSFREFLDP